MKTMENASGITMEDVDLWVDGLLAESEYVALPPTGADHLQPQHTSDCAPEDVASAPNRLDANGITAQKLQPSMPTESAVRDSIPAANSQASVSGTEDDHDQMHNSQEGELETAEMAGIHSEIDEGDESGEGELVTVRPFPRSMLRHSQPQHQLQHRTMTGSGKGIYGADVAEDVRQTELQARMCFRSCPRVSKEGWSGER